MVERSKHNNVYYLYKGRFWEVLGISSYDAGDKCDCLNLHLDLICLSTGEICHGVCPNEIESASLVDYMKYKRKEGLK